jgi:signal peptide peptidase SppA
MNLLAELANSPHYFVNAQAFQTFVETLKQQEISAESMEKYEASRASREAEEVSDIYQEVDSTAIITVNGPIFPSSTYMTYYGYAVALTSLKAALEKARQKSSIKDVVLAMHTPGGSIYGVSEFGDYVKSYEKPITTYVTGMCCSAGYWIASNTNKIVGNKTSIVGSIGVICSLINPEYDKYYIDITNRKSPNKNPNPATKEGKGVIQDELDALAEVFIETVAEGRDVSVETVENDFGKGGVLIGEKAKQVGMMDEISSFESSVTHLSKGSSASRKPSKEKNMKNLEEAFAKYPALEAEHKAAIEAAAKEAAVKAEKDENVKADENKTETSETPATAANAGNGAIEAALGKVVTALSGLNGKIEALEKTNLIREEKDKMASASALADSILATAPLSATIKDKIKASVGHEKATDENGVFDANKFGDLIKAEIADFAKAFGQSYDVQGAASGETPVGDDGVMAEADISDLLGSINITLEEGGA